jgi:hypothetical protein
LRSPSQAWREIPDKQNSNAAKGGAVGLKAAPPSAFDTFATTLQRRLASARSIMATLLQHQRRGRSNWLTNEEKPTITWTSFVLSRKPPGDYV